MPGESQTHLDHNTKHISMEEAGDWLLRTIEKPGGCGAIRNSQKVRQGRTWFSSEVFLYVCLILMHMSYLYKKILKKNISSRN